jgi:hypothetical protein
VRSLARGWAAATVAVSLVGVLIQLVIVVAGVSTVSTQTFPLPVRLWHFVSYFTIQSNLLVIVTVLPLVREPRHDGRVWRVLRLAALVMITVTGLVHWFLLRPLSTLTGWEAVGDVAVHVVAPVLTVLGWLAFGPRPRTDGPTVLRSLIWPIAWLGYTLVVGAATGWYPYPFLDVGARGAVAVAATCAVIAVLVAGLSTVCWRLDRVLSVSRATIRP